MDILCYFLIRISMTKETIINAIPFPIFAATADGHIVYKNRSAMRYIGTMRKGSHIARYFLYGKLPKSESIAVLAVKTPYPNALTVADENESWFFCFPRLQYPDAEIIAEELFEAFGRTPSAILHVFSEYQRVRGKSRKFPSRIYTDLAHLLPQTISEEAKAHPLKELIHPLFEKTAAAFGALGYRIQTEADGILLNDAPIIADRFDLIFFFGRMLYCMMKLSRDGDIMIRLASDPSSGAPLLRFYTHTDCKLPKNLTLLELFAKVAPECAAELFLMGRSEHLRHTATVTVDMHGGCTVEYRIPYLASALILHSDVFAEMLSMPIDRELFRIALMLKETRASCRYSSAEN